MLWSVVLIALVAGAGRAQNPPATSGVLPPTVQLGDAQKAFDDIVQSFEKRLLGAGAFTLDVVSQWQSTGVGEDRKGTNIFHVAVQAGGKLRIEAGSKESGRGTVGLRQRRTDDHAAAADRRVQPARCGHRARRNPA